jgi:hypothetical protein
LSQKALWKGETMHSGKTTPKTQKDQLRTQEDMANNELKAKGTLQIEGRGRMALLERVM